ncbi:MAG: hypothetical protein J0L93_09105 [Deltaproteobacteria bacterium]|nr:hypothetical protein [Deltaproteobacteria bacterium]
MNVLFIADEFEKLNPKSDTSLMILHSLLKLRKLNRIKSFWATDKHFSWTSGGLEIGAQEILKSQAFQIPKARDLKTYAIKNFDLIFIRKNPPFDRSYVNLCWLLAPYEKSIKMVNSPSALLRHHEKMLPLEAQVLGFLKESDLIPTCVTRDEEIAKKFIQKQKGSEFILKPFYGFGGTEIEVISRSELLAKLKVILSHEADRMIQPLQKEIYELGDRRVFFFKGKYAGDIVRLPKTGSVVSNLAQGGSAAFRPLSASEKKVIQKLEKYLKSIKVDFAGADLIGDKVSEVNVTSPTGFAAYQNILKKDLTEKFLNSILK